jgi:diaminopimelate decarboxylase
VKTHPLARLVEWWAGTGRGVEVVSEAELAGAIHLGCPPGRLLVNGVAKHHWLHRHHIPDLRVHFDSLVEMEALLPLAVACGWRVGIRLHAPDERDARDSRFGGPFGMTAAEGVAALQRLQAAGAALESVHFHLGQRPATPDVWSRAVTHAARVCHEAGFEPRFLDCGGGLPGYHSAGQDLSGWRAAVHQARLLFPRLEEVWAEHGRFLLEHASVLAVRVLDVKERPECRYLICDGGRTNHALAADKGPHALSLLPGRSGAPRLTTVSGPTCMTDDVLGRFELPADVAAGDTLVWMDAGAYHLPWETRFSHGRCAVAWCDERDVISLARGRERPEEWMTPCPR